MRDEDLPAAETVGRVSLVDGDPTVRRARQLMLRAEHYEVKAYATCSALLADLGSLERTCLVAELDMPGIDGFELLDKMRAKGWEGPVILLADSPSPAGVLRASGLGAAALLPISVADRFLLDAIHAAVHAPTATA